MSSVLPLTQGGYVFATKKDCVRTLQNSSSMASQDVDVLVVGAGPTGLTLAGELLRFGLSVSVIYQAAQQPLDHSRALVLHARTLEVFEQLGIVDEAYKRGTPIDAVNIISSIGRCARCCVLDVLYK